MARIFSCFLQLFSLVCFFFVCVVFSFYYCKDKSKVKRDRKRASQQFLFFLYFCLLFFLLKLRHTAERIQVKNKNGIFKKNVTEKKKRDSSSCILKPSNKENRRTTIIVVRIYFVSFVSLLFFLFVVSFSPEEHHPRTAHSRHFVHLSFRLWLLQLQNGTWIAPSPARVV